MTPWRVRTRPFVRPILTIQPAGAIGISLMADEKPWSEPVARDILLLILANIFWGATDVVAKFALSEMSPVALLWTRVSIALIFLAPALYARKKEIPQSLIGFLPFIALGLAGFALNFTLVYYGLRLAPASHATALRVTESLTIVFLSALLLREKVRGRAVFGLVAGILGVVLVLNIDFKNLSLFTSGSRRGDLLILAGILVEGFYTVIGKSVLKKVSPITATGLALFCGWLILTMVFGVRIAAEFGHQVPSARAFLAAAYLGVIATSIGYWIYYKVLSRRASHRVGISIMIQPLVGIPLAALIFHDPMTPQFLIGAVLIAGGVYLALGKGSEIKNEG